MSNIIYIIEMPNKPAREVSGINYVKISDIVAKQGGKIYPKPVAKPVPFVARTSFNAPIIPAKPKYMWGEVLVIAENIKEKHFAHSNAVMKIRVSLGRRTTRRLGLCRMRYDYSHQYAYRFAKIATEIVLSKELLNGRSSDKLEQVIYHELVHAEFPNEGHRGMNFRNKEYHNPFRGKKTKRLTCVS